MGRMIGMRKLEFYRKSLSLPLLLLLVFGTVSCATQNERILGTEQSQVALRQIQTRSFDTTDKDKVLRTIIATLQDLGFVIDRANSELGSVSATKLDGYALRMTATVRPRGETQSLVRVNAQYENMVVEDPEPYQDFFVALEKSMFLTAHAVD